MSQASTIQSPQQRAMEKTRQHLQRLQAMTKEEKKEFLIESGILSRSGKLTTQYGGKEAQDKKAMARARAQGRYVY